VDHREAPVVKNWLDDREVSDALRQVYGPAAEWMDLGRLLAEIRDPTADQADSQRYWLNQIVASSDQWLSLEAWRTRVSSAEVDVGDPIAMGFDGSVKDDATALIGCRLTDGHLFKLGIWAKPTDYRGDDWEVPRAEVDREVHSAMNTYNVARLYCDPPYWRSEIEAWAAEFGDEIVIQFPTNQYRRTASALERLHTAVLTNEVSHDGNRVFEEHVANARKLEHRSGTLIQKEHKRSPRKIDAAMAAVLAFEARADAVASGALKRRKSKIPVSL
jgi:phage terminase large subunit-like protein